MWIEKKKRQHISLSKLPFRVRLPAARRDETTIKNRKTTTFEIKVRQGAPTSSIRPLSSLPMTIPGKILQAEFETADDVNRGGQQQACPVRAHIPDETAKKDSHSSRVRCREGEGVCCSGASFGTGRRSEAGFAVASVRKRTGQALRVIDVKSRVVFPVSNACFGSRSISYVTREFDRGIIKLNFSTRITFIPAVQEGEK